MTLELLRAFTQGRQLRRRRVRRRHDWSAPASASSTPRARTRCTATSPASRARPPAAASASRSSCTSGPGRCGAGSPRSPGPSTRWSRRNAYFNLTKLGAVPDEYLPNFYGPMTDGINGGDDTDRLLVRWRLRAPAVARPAPAPRRGLGGRRLARGAAVALSVAADGEPVAGRLDGRPCRWSPCRRTSSRSAPPLPRWPHRLADRGARGAVRPARRRAAGRRASTGPAGTS